MKKDVEWCPFFTKQAMGGIRKDLPEELQRPAGEEEALLDDDCDGQNDRYEAILARIRKPQPAHIRGGTRAALAAAFLALAGAVISQFVRNKDLEKQQEDLGNHAGRLVRENEDLRKQNAVGLGELHEAHAKQIELARKLIEAQFREPIFRHPPLPQEQVEMEFGAPVFEREIEVEAIEIARLGFVYVRSGGDKYAMLAIGEKPAFEIGQKITVRFTEDHFLKQFNVENAAKVNEQFFHKQPPRKEEIVGKHVLDQPLYQRDIVVESVFVKDGVAWITCKHGEGSGDTFTVFNGHEGRFAPGQKLRVQFTADKGSPRFWVTNHEDVITQAKALAEKEEKRWKVVPKMGDADQPAELENVPQQKGRHNQDQAPNQQAHAEQGAIIPLQAGQNVAAPARVLPEAQADPDQEIGAGGIHELLRGKKLPPTKKADPEKKN